jgi:hypothetical protein
MGTSTSPVPVDWVAVDSTTNLSLSVTPVDIDWTMTTSITSLNSALGTVDVDWDVVAPDSAIGTVVEPVPIDWLPVEDLTLTFQMNLDPIYVDWSPILPSTALELSIANPVPVDWSLVTPTTGITMDASVFPIAVDWVPLVPDIDFAIAIDPVVLRWVPLAVGDSGDIGEILPAYRSRFVPCEESTLRGVVCQDEYLGRASDISGDYRSIPASVSDYRPMVVTTTEYQSRGVPVDGTALQSVQHSGCEPSRQIAPSTETRNESVPQSGEPLLATSEGSESVLLQATTTETRALHPGDEVQ